MALALVQSGDTGAFNASGATENVLPGATGLANCVLLAIVTEWVPGGGGDVSSVSSPMGTFTRVGQIGLVFGSVLRTLEYWVCLTTSGASRAVTVSTSGGYGWTAQGTEWSGGVGSATFVSGSFGNPFCAVTIPSTPGDAVVACNVWGDYSAVYTGFTGSGFTDYNTGAFSWPGNATGQDVAYGIFTGPETVYATWTTSGTTNCINAAAILSGTMIVPNTPTLTAPPSAGYQDATATIPFTATYNAFGSDPMSHYALRVKTSVGSYGYWNGTNFSSSSPVWNALSILPGGSFTINVPGSVLSNGNIYNWSFACQDAVSGGDGDFAPDFTFTAQAVPTCVVSAPTGSVATTTQPTVTWSGTFPSGASQTRYLVIVETGSYTTVPGHGTQVWSSTLVTSPATSVMIGNPLISGSTYRVFVQLTETGGQVSAWAYNTFTITVPVPSTPEVQAVATVDSNGCPIILVEVQGVDNMLSLADSVPTNGSGTGGWVATGAALGSGAPPGGGFGLSLTSSGGGTITAQTHTGLLAVPVLGDTEYTALANFRAVATARNCEVLIDWYDSGGTFISSSTSTPVSDVTGSWTQASVTDISPVNAAFANVRVSIASTAASEVHWYQRVQIAPDSATVWNVGGFVGSTSAVIIRSDNVYVRYASNNNPLPLPVGDQDAVVYDYEVTPGMPYTYSVVLQDLTGPVTSVPVVTTPAVELNTTNWWELDPTAGDATSNPSAVNAQMIGWSPVNTEQSSASPVINQATMTIQANTMMSQDFNAQAEIFLAAVYVAFNALLLGQKTVFVSSPWGETESGFFRIGPLTGGQGGGSGTTAKTSNLLPSTAAAPHRMVAVTGVAQPRPPV